MYIKYNMDKKMYYAEKDLNGSCGWYEEEKALQFIKDNLKYPWRVDKMIDQDEKDQDEKNYIIYNSKKKLWLNCKDNKNIYLLNFKDEYSKFKKIDAENFAKMFGKEYVVYEYDEIMF